MNKIVRNRIVIAVTAFAIGGLFGGGVMSKAKGMVGMRKREEMSYE